MKNCRSWDEEGLVKMGDVAHIGGGSVYRKEGKHCLSLVINGFCKSNALYSVGFSLRMFIIISD